MVSAYLTQNGFEVKHVETAQEGMHLLQSAAAAQPFSLILLDVMLPDADGLEVCRQIRSHASAVSATPIVMLTAKGDPMDRVVGLELGADDYVPKPFEPRELLARVRAVLRRNQGNTAVASNVLRFGRLEIDLDARAIRLDGHERMVTGYQFDLLVALAERAGRVLSREQIMDAVKGEPLEAFDRSIDVHIGRLRAVLEDDPKQPRRIITVRGSGYVFAKAQDV
jgi:DNA-binding response OmpR family regulator